MDIKKELEFMKRYYQLLKFNSNQDIGHRFFDQLKQLHKTKEISDETYSIISGLLVVGENLLDNEIDNETIEKFKNFINIGQQIEGEKIEKEVFDKLLPKEEEEYKDESWDML